jgi:hypothetical protein
MEIPETWNSRGRLTGCGMAFDAEAKRRDDKEWGMRLSRVRGAAGREMETKARHCNVVKVGGS